MRCSQPMGLPGDAEVFLLKNAIRIDRCLKCDRDSGYKTEVIGTYGMYDDQELLKYHLTDGRTAKESIQYEVWSSGPMTWLSLKCGDVEFKWPEEAMED